MNEAALEAFATEVEKIAEAYSPNTNLRANPEGGPPRLQDSLERQQKADNLTALLKSNRPQSILGAIAGSALGGAILPNMLSAGNIISDSLMRFGEGESAAKVEAMRRYLAKAGVDDATARKVAQGLWDRQIPHAVKQNLGTAGGSSFSSSLQIAGMLDAAKKQGLMDEKEFNQIIRRHPFNLMKQRLKPLGKTVLIGGALGGIGGFVYNRRQRKARQALLERHGRAMREYQLQQMGLKRDT